MITTTHMLVGAAIFARPGHHRLTWAALAGGLAPDFSLYAMFFWYRFIQGKSARVIFDDLYFTPCWQAVFAIDNSFFVWGGLLAVSALARTPAVPAFAATGALHVLMDFPVHNDDARAHFWPLTMWKFESPVSYWDPAHYGHIFGLFETLFILGLCLLLWCRFTRLWPRIVIATTALMTAAPAILFGP
ncbi:MAG: cobalamin biosynthesis protein CobQ [Rhodobacteraceae bacterium]|nr:cobalamin biosynthesis protein CobQ [Paracoccaceae bacterium]